MKRIGLVFLVLTCLASMFLSGCGGGATSNPMTAVFHVSWVGSPEITKVKVSVVVPANNPQVRIVSRSDGDTDVTMNLNTPNSLLRIEAVDQFGIGVADPINQLAVAETTLKVGGTPTQAAILKAHAVTPVNNSTVLLPVAIGVEFVPVPTDAQGAICLLPVSDFTLSFSDSSVVDYSAPLIVGGKAPGSTQVSLIYQSATLGQFGLVVFVTSQRPSPPTH